MTNPDAPLPIIMDCAAPQDTNPYLHQGAYAINRNPKTAQPRNYPISEAVRKSYVQQKLPVRHQSLAAAALLDKQDAPWASDASDTLHAPIQPPIRTVSLSRPMVPRVPDPAPVATANATEEDDDFNFGDRPPSMLICTEPIPAAAHDTDTDTPMTPETPAAVFFSAAPEIRTEPAAQLKQSQSDSTVGSITLNSPQENDEEQQPVPSTSDATHARTSMFLRMKYKREEHRKSIFAYRASMAQPMVYPALLSLVGRELYQRLPTINVVKDDVAYHHVFRGKDAVDRLLQILRTTDRNLALLVGRALDAQYFLHDVNYENRLRDSPDQLYRFRDEMGVPLGAVQSPRKKTEVMEGLQLPTGVFTVLTDCYSPTCTRDQTCYSVFCPRKTGKNLGRTQSQSSEDKTTRNLWTHSVPKEVVEATSPEERQRQECIYELIHTEQDFVHDLQYIHNFWVKPLIIDDIIPSERREHFVQEVFWNMTDIEKVNRPLCQALLERQKENALVHCIGDIMLEHACHFAPFVGYGAHQVIGKFHFELEKKRNPLFAQFVEETERKVESRRLELNGYLTKPTTRLGRYNLLLREILKHTPEGNPDRDFIPKVMDLITEFLEQVNAETGQSENIFNLQQIEDRLSFKSSMDYVDLKLREPGRQLIMKGRMKRKVNSSSDSSDLQVFLFDHYLVFAKIKHYNYLEYYKVYRKPIPLELLSLSVPGNSSSTRAKRASSILPYSRSSTLLSATTLVPKPSTSESMTSNTKSGSFAMIFYHHGRRASTPLTLYVSGSSARKAWLEKIRHQQKELSNKRKVFRIQPLLQRQFPLNNKVTSSAVLVATNGEKRLLVGADQGVYLSDVLEDDGDPTEETDVTVTATRVLAVDKVTQIHLVENTQLLVLADKTLWDFSVDNLVAGGDQQAKRARAVSQNANFFHVGSCMNKTLISVVKTGTLKPTTIRVFEPVAAEEDKKSKRALIKRLVRTGSQNLRPYRDLYLPSEAYGISLLKTKMCVSCPQEIGIIDMKSFEVQSLLDPDDEELSFVFSRQDVRPITIYRVKFAEYLVCYNAFAFFVDQRGRLIKSARRIDWEGLPESFVFYPPYIIAFEPEIIEVWNLETCDLVQLIRGTHIRCTNNFITDDQTPVIHGTMSDPDNEGYQLLFHLVKQ